MIMEQRTEEWFQARLGKVTASRMADVIAKTKTGWGASRATYMGELIAERLTGVSAERYSNAAMQWGVDTEDEARIAYQFERMLKVVETGFIPHPAIEMAGASPDGYVGEHGLVEIKCPNTATHIDTLLSQTIPAKYVSQMQWQMACTGRRWCDFVSYDPRLPDNMRIFIRRVERSNAVIGGLETNVREFLDELETKLRALTERYGEVKAAA
jgi:putative phage-type endonuclease